MSMSAAQSGSVSFMLAGSVGQQLAAVVENSDDAIVSKDLDGKILSWNDAATGLYGFTAGEAIGRPIDIVIPVDPADPVFGGQPCQVRPQPTGDTQPPAHERDDQERCDRRDEERDRARSRRPGRRGSRAWGPRPAPRRRRPRLRRRPRAARPHAAPASHYAGGREDYASSHGGPHLRKWGVGTVSRVRLS